MRDILPVYAVIATVVFGWSILAFIWKLPSWILFLNLGEILSILAYTLSVDLLESLFWLAVFLVLGMVLPAAVLKDHFTARSTIISLLVLSSLGLFVNRYGEWGQKLLNYSALWILVTISTAVLAAYLSSKFSLIARAAIWIADRVTVFLFLYVPLAIFSVIAVLIRNMF